MIGDHVGMAGKRILVVEDDYFIAKSLARDLLRGGADVIGPVPTIAEALDLIAVNRFDGGVLDVNLRGEMAYSVADALSEQGVPFVLATGYSAAALPARYASVPLRQTDRRWRSRCVAAALFPN